MSQKKCCIRWDVLRFTSITLFVSHYKYIFSKLKHCPECGQSLRGN